MNVLSSKLFGEMDDMLTLLKKAEETVEGWWSS